MTIDEAWAKFKDHSTKASDVSRQLAFAGIAVVWIFKAADPPKLPPELLTPLAAFCLVLAFDLLQYTVAAIIWLTIVRSKERYFNKANIPLTSQFTDPDNKLQWPAFCFFWLKIVALLCGQVTLIAYVIRLWKLV